MKAMHLPQRTPYYHQLEDDNDDDDDGLMISSSSSSSHRTSRGMFRMPKLELFPQSSSSSSSSSRRPRRPLPHVDDQGLATQEPYTPSSITEAMEDDPLSLDRCPSNDSSTVCTTNTSNVVVVTMNDGLDEVLLRSSPLPVSKSKTEASPHPSHGRPTHRRTEPFFF